MDSDYHKLEDHLKQEGLIIPLDKPVGWTSFDVVNKVRIHLKYHHNIPRIKTGHAGTLDPLATGLLIVCVGKTTKNIESLQNLRKTYTGTFCLGQSTPSFDAESEVTERLPVDHISEKMIHDAAHALEGDQMQVPPLFSAIKIGGKRAYRLARKNQDVELKARPVTIYSFEILSIKDENVRFSITCSKGTYIRSIARDFGRMLGSCAYLSELRRTAIGHYDISQAMTMDQFHEAFNIF